MSRHIPFDIQEEIIKRLPLKSVIKFSFVSKSWKSLIDSSKFITDYNVRHIELRYLLVMRNVFSVKGVAITLDNYPKILGTSKGLLFHCKYNNFKQAILWNPSIQKSVAINLPVKISSYNAIVGFGICPDTNKLKIVKITYMGNNVWLKVRVFTGYWRSRSRAFHHSYFKEVLRGSLLLDGISYWLAIDGKPYRDYGWYDLIMSFDLTNEEFRDSYVSYAELDLFISKVRKSSFVHVTSKTNPDASKHFYSALTTQHYARISFAKLSSDASLQTVYGFRRSGETIYEMQNKHEDNFEEEVLVVCKPFSGYINYIRIHGKRYSFLTHVHHGQLLLLDH